MKLTNDLVITISVDPKDATQAVQLRDDIHEQLKDNLDYQEGRISLGTINDGDRFLTQLVIKNDVNPDILNDININFASFK